MAEPTEVHSDVPVTLTLDLDALMAKTQRWGEDGREDVYGDIITAAAHMVANRMYLESTEYRDRLRDAIDAQLEKIVGEALEQRYQPTDSYGSPQGEPTTLRAQIGKQAGEFMAKAMQPGNRYGDGTGAVKKFIETEVDRQIKGELQEAVKQARAAVVARVKDNAAAVITDVITRSAVR